MEFTELPNIEYSQDRFYRYNFDTDTVKLVWSRTLDHCLRNINHEWLHRILLMIGEREACLNFDSLKTYGEIIDIVVGAMVEPHVGELLYD